jgi:hypothetical protein
MHDGEITKDETWAAATPHVISGGLNVVATLTVEPCAQITIAPDVTVTFGLKGTLVANGTAQTPITVGARDAGKPWAQLRAIGGAMHLAYVTFSDGGNPPSNTVPTRFGAIYTQKGSDASAPENGLFVDHVTVKGSRSNGLMLEASAGFAAGSTTLTVSGSAAFPVRIAQNVIGTVPLGGSFSGNAPDEIVVEGRDSSVINTDQTIHVLPGGIPYRIGADDTNGDLMVSKGSLPAALLTIEAGVTLKFKQGGSLIVEQFIQDAPATGALNAVGNSSAMIHFVSAQATPAPGDWVGVVLNSQLDSRTSIQFASIEFAGAITGTIGDSCETGNAQAGIIFNHGQPSGTQVFGNSTIVSSAKHGIWRGWTGDPVELMTTNTFTSVPGCKETYPVPSMGQCPMPSPCP